MVDFKLGAIFAANRAVFLECHDKLTFKPRHVPDRGNPRETFGSQQTTHTPSSVPAAVPCVTDITHGVPDRGNHRGISIVKLYKQFSQEPMEIQFIGMSGINMRAGNSVKGHTSVLRFIKQKL